LKTLLLILCFASALATANSDSQNAWQKALALQQEGKFEQAIPLWQAALHQASAEGLPTAGAHWNLGLCCLKVQLPDCSAHHWLASISASASLGHIAKVTQALTQLQSSLGLSTAATAGIDFFLASNVGQNAAAMAGAVAFWLLIAGLVGLGRTKNVARIAWFGSFFAVCVLSGFCWYSSKQLPLYRAVGQQAQDAPIYAAAESGNAIATLPAGTVVKTAQRVSGFTQITAPLPGWLSDSVFSEPLSGTPNSLRGAKHSAAR
jgi:hypothetical protein